MSTALMASPRLEPMTLVAPGTQVLVAGEWKTVCEIGACDMERVHGPQCNLYVLEDGTEIAHAVLSTEVWMRHPVGAR